MISFVRRVRLQEIKKKNKFSSSSRISIGSIEYCSSLTKTIASFDPFHIFFQPIRKFLEMFIFLNFCSTDLNLQFLLSLSRY